MTDEQRLKIEQQLARLDSAMTAVRFELSVVGDVRREIAEALAALDAEPESL